MLCTANILSKNARKMAFSAFEKKLIFFQKCIDKRFTKCYNGGIKKGDIVMKNVVMIVDNCGLFEIEGLCSDGHFRRVRHGGFDSFPSYVLLCVDFYGNHESVVGVCDSTGNLIGG